MQRLAALFLLCLGSAVGLRAGAQLPRIRAQASGEQTAALEREGKWWAHLGDYLYHAPPSSSGLSGSVGDYYYAFGSESALPEELRSKRVGGQGRLHIFHLPEGPAMLQVDATVGNRRSAISVLKQVTERMELSHTFPPYEMDKDYKNHQGAAAKQIEKEVVSKLTEDGLMAELKEVTSFKSRSFRDAQASADVQSFLRRKFEATGYTVCLHTFMGAGPATNIVAYAPGTDGGSEELVVLGAHYDDIPAYGLAPGAEDNGSGLAALLGIMKAFSEGRVQTKTSVAFVAFAGEEAGLYGSEAYIRGLLHSDRMAETSDMYKCVPPQATTGRSRPADSIKAIVMDEIGWQSPSLASPTVNLETYDWTSEIMEQLAHASRDHNGAALTIVHSKNPFGSDHMSFLNRKVPAVLTINGDDEAYPFYHTSRDEIEHVTGSLVAMIAKMNMGGLLRIAEIDA